MKKEKATVSDIEKIVRNYRKKHSYFFLFIWAVLKRPAKSKSFKKELKKSSQLALLVGLSQKDLKQLSGIYQGLKKELGYLKAMSACMQIVKISV